METIPFTQDGVQYVLYAYGDEDILRFEVREEDTNLFVKTWSGVSQKYFDSYVKSAKAGGKVVLKRDLLDLRVLEYTEGYIGTYGKSPRQRDVAIALDIGQSDVVQSHKRLVDKGIITKVPHLARAYSLVHRREDL